ncbi:hypothetical protein HHL28_02740 [Aerophototrophica crusticola]|uniref:Polysaccharide chain length determinant N-terminal domain-containing protein n=1 Tax=Aerophototrophica crusticola TaxID=1709002 RepID=A0A858R4Q3_9PROT|nr:hypothetical protein HHL28_02740 [Rhodospirillaceae bacterium B3]
MDGGLHSIPVAVGQLRQDLRASWRGVLWAGLAGFLLALAGLWLVTPQYTAAITIGPTGRIGPAGMGMRVPSAVTNPVRPVAEGGSGEELLSDFSRYLELMVSVPVAERLAADTGLMARLFPSAWDADLKEWRPAMDPMSLGARLLRWLVGQPTWAPPDAVSLSRHLRRKLTLEKVHGGPIHRISFRHEDRAFAIMLVSRLHMVADRLLREEAARRTGKEVDYVRDKLKGISKAGDERALGALLADQERILMMLDIDLPFAADVIEPAHAQALPDWPNPVVLLPLGAVAGMGLMVFAVTARLGLTRFGR